MASPAQAAANRANAHQSTGPRTPEGKAKMCQNPLRHGLTSRHLIIPGEQQEDFDALLADLREDYDPVGHDEEQLVAALAEHYWRLLRARRAETATLAIYVERLLEEEESGGDPDRALALAFERHGRELNRLLRYETTIERTYLRTRRELEEIQSTRFRMEAALGSVSQNAEIAGERESPAPFAAAVPDLRPCPAPSSHAQMRMSPHETARPHR